MKPRYDDVIPPVTDDQITRAARTLAGQPDADTVAEAIGLIGYVGHNRVTRPPISGSAS